MIVRTSFILSMFLVSLLFIANVALAKDNQVIDINLPKTGEGRDVYFVSLLSKALNNIGYTANINYVGDISYQREIKYLKTGNLTLTWRLQTKERDRNFERIDVPLTNGLIGSRVLLIPTGKQEQYTGLSSIEQFRDSGLVGGLHKHWLDAQVWDHNDLPFIAITGPYMKLFKLVASKNRGIDYFSRSVIEVMGEVGLVHGLKIEENLLFKYDVDFYYYLGNINPDIKSILRKAVINAESSGLRDELIENHWGYLTNKLSLDSRIEIKLVTPTD